MADTENKIIYKDEFDKIWVNIVLPLLDKYCRKYGLKCKHRRYIETRVWHSYNNLRDLFIKKYMRYDVKNIDRHKIAACMMKAILNTKPFYIPLNIRFGILFTKNKLNKLFKTPEPYACDNNINNYIFYANEYLALSVALSIIDGYIQADSEKDMKHGMILPDPFSDDDPDYLLDVCIDLHFSGHRKINIVTFANVFFLWEKYSCRRTQCENLEEELLAQYICHKSFNELSEEEKNNVLENSPETIIKRIESIKFQNRDLKK